MFSKPPGRRMVTSDIHNFFVNSFHFLNMSYYISLLARVLFGHLPFSVIFVLVELMKQGLFVSLSIFNISTLIQTSFILNHNWVHIYEDKVCICLDQEIITVSLMTSACQVIVIDSIEYTLVSCFPN